MYLLLCFLCLCCLLFYCLFRLSFYGESQADGEMDEAVDEETPTRTTNGSSRRPGTPKEGWLVRRITDPNGGGWGRSAARDGAAGQAPAARTASQAAAKAMDKLFPGEGKGNAKETRRSNGHGAGMGF